jgi:hypothetical protein
MSEELTRSVSDQYSLFVLCKASFVYPDSSVTFKIFVGYPFISRCKGSCPENKKPFFLILKLIIGQQGSHWGIELVLKTVGFLWTCIYIYIYINIYTYSLLSQFLTFLTLRIKEMIFDLKTLQSIHPNILNSMNKNIQTRPTSAQGMSKT